MPRKNPCPQLKPFPMAPYVMVTEETTSADIARYLADIKACGFSAFRTGNAPAYRGEGDIVYTVSDLFFQLAEEFGLQVLTHYQMGYCDWMADAPYRIDRQRCLLDDAYHRLLDAYFTAVVTRYRAHPCLLGWVGIGEPGSFPDSLLHDPQVRAQYVAWLQGQYGTLERLECAWGYGCRLPHGAREGMADAMPLGQARVTAWDGQELWAGDAFEKYRHQRDWLRFQTEFLLDRMTTCERAMLRADDRHPVLTGIHNVLDNAAARTWDFALQAGRADGLMSSIHPAWHSWIGDFEYFLPLYVQARMTRDFAKGAWAIPYETTGGPNFRAASRGFNMHAAERYQMILAYLAAGLQGAGFWVWNARLTGYEAGEYALTNLQGTPSARARLLGDFARRMQQWSDELYDTRAERLAAVLYSWENEAFCACGGRLNHAECMQRDAPSRHRLGAARALTNANIPWEFLTDGELMAGAARGYPALIAPGMPLVSHAAMEALTAYVAQGGTLVVDMPFGLYDEYGRVRTEGAGGEYDRLLGAYLADVFQTFHEPMALADLPVQGAFGEWVATAATVQAAFADGRPAVLEHRLGAGRAVCLAFEVCSRCAVPGQAAYERLLADTVMAGRRRAWTCAGVLAFRRRVGDVDYYYLINPGPACTTEVRVADARYRTVRDVMADRDLILQPSVGHGCAIPVHIPQGLGCWLRCERDHVGSGEEPQRSEHQVSE